MINKLHFDTCIDVKIHREVFLSRGVILSAQSAVVESSLKAIGIFHRSWLILGSGPEKEGVL